MDHEEDYFEEAEKKTICFCFKVKTKDSVYQRNQKKNSQIKSMKDMTPSEKKERLAYLRFRVKVIASAVLFIYVLRRSHRVSEDHKMRKIRLKVMVDDSGPIVELDK